MWTANSTRSRFIPARAGNAQEAVRLGLRSSGSSPRVRGTPGQCCQAGRADRFIPARAGNAGGAPFRPGGRSVHPRACGERPQDELVVLADFGSSPRVRGTRSAPARRHRPRRFIPARAGNAGVPIGLPRRRAVHPRACGERWTLPPDEGQPAGSSPRVRGTPGRRDRRARRMRFIPARAGNAAGCASTGARPAVHPRACGERVAQRGDDQREAGSSPRVRGTLPGRLPGRGRIRFIPARAGNAIRPSMVRFHGSVHPRACGERTIAPTWTGLHTGSSPRVRGTRDGVGAGHPSSRFIPARAGNAVRIYGCVLQRSVHPRACGERCCGMVRNSRPHWFIPARAGNASISNSDALVSAVHPRACGERNRTRLQFEDWAGSSPRVRGTHLGHVEHAVGRRFIPARAGNAFVRAYDDHDDQVHPRACGERRTQARLDRSHNGSSPRVRGTQLLIRKQRHAGRFIPARAGNARSPAAAA